MKERPILFSAPMVRAILAGTKTQTRRIIKPGLRNPGWTRFAFFPQRGIAIECGEDYPDGKEDQRRCPYGKPGDRLWVRETFGDCTPGACALGGTKWDSPWYRANADEYGLLGHDGEGPVYVEDIHWRPSIHMPRWASRITLEVTDVRVERLQEINEQDTIAEGWPHAATNGVDAPLRDAYPIGWFANLWGDINGPDSWPANPWVWVIAFRRADPTQ